MTLVEEISQHLIAAQASLERAAEATRPVEHRRLSLQTAQAQMQMAQTLANIITHGPKGVHL